MTYIKNLSIISLIFGAISGFLALLPILGIIILLMLIFCSSFIIITFMKKFSLIPPPNEQTGMLWGGISGFLTFIGFSVIFLPCSFVLSLIFKFSYFTGVGMIMKSGFSVMIMLVLFLAVLCGMMNAFAGLASVYFFNNSQSAILPQKGTKDVKDVKFSLNIKKRK